MCVTSYFCRDCHREVPWEENESGFPTRVCNDCLEESTPNKPPVILTKEPANSRIFEYTRQGGD